MLDLLICPGVWNVVGMCIASPTCEVSEDGVQKEEKCQACAVVFGICLYYGQRMVPLPARLWTWLAFHRASSHHAEQAGDWSPREEPGTSRTLGWVIGTYRRAWLAMGWGAVDTLEIW